MAKGPALLR